jgi:hypothetical protein
MADRSGYIGRAPGDSSIIIARQTNQPTATTSTFVFNSGYDVGYLDVYVNGSKLINALDYQATDTQNVVLTTPAVNGDVIEFVAYKAFNLTQVITETTGDLNVEGSITATNNITASGNISGVDGTFSGDVTATGNVTATDGTFSGDINAVNGNFTGILTAPTIISTNVSVSGALTATSYYGDGSTLTGVGVGIQSGGEVVGSGITTLNFIGVGNTFKVTGNTVDISIEGGGGGGLTTTGISTGFIFSNPNFISESVDLTQPDHNYGMFGPITVSVGATVLVGSGNTFTVV